MIQAAIFRFTPNCFVGIGRPSHTYSLTVCNLLRSSPYFFKNKHHGTLTTSRRYGTVYRCLYYALNKRDWYDGKGHEGYPERMGWTKDNLLGIVPPGEDGPPFGKDNEQPRDDATIERFFQSWLYFGTAIEFFKVGGGHILETESFLVLLPIPEPGKAQAEHSDSGGYTDSRTMLHAPAPCYKSQRAFTVGHKSSYQVTNRITKGIL